MPLEFSLELEFGSTQPSPVGKADMRRSSRDFLQRADARTQTQRFVCSQIVPWLCRFLALPASTIILGCVDVADHNWSEFATDHGLWRVRGVLGLGGKCTYGSLMI